jgi:hypothetical protein
MANAKFFVERADVNGAGPEQIANVTLRYAPQAGDAADLWAKKLLTETFTMTVAGDAFIASLPSGTVLNINLA